MGSKLIFATALTVFLFAATLVDAGERAEAVQSETSSQPTHESKAIKKFRSLLAEMDDLNLPREMSDFWQINTEIRIAMRRELEQATHDAEPVDSDGAGRDAPGDQAERTRRMEAISMESHGLESVLASGDLDVMERYRHLLGEFLNLMRGDLDESDVELGRNENPH